MRFVTTLPLRRGSGRLLPVTEVPITPDLLAWAVRESGYTPSEFAVEVGEDESVVRAWISAEARPGLGLALHLKEAGHEVTVVSEERKDKPDKMSLNTACGLLRLYCGAPQDPDPRWASHASGRAASRRLVLGAIALHTLLDAGAVLLAARTGPLRVEAAAAVFGLVMVGLTLALRGAGEGTGSGGQWAPGAR